MRGAGILFGVSTAALAWSAPAMAQDATDDQTANAAEAEIVVTATRRAENLMQTAISGSVLTGDDLANRGVVNVDALQFATPSIVVNNFGQGNDFNVRGIGKAEHNTQTTTGVITYRDGVPTFPGYFQGEPYYDVANIQVLRGPQGTIVGQNATGGAVFVNSNEPVIGGGVHGYIQASIGNYDELGGQFAVNVPVSDTFAARFAFYGQRRDGFYNITGPGGSKSKENNDLGIAAGRISFKWEPSANFTLLSMTDLDYLDFGAYPANPYYQSFETLPNGAPNPTYTDLFDISANAPMSARDKFFRSILKAEYTTDGGYRFRSISSIQRGNTQYEADLDGTSSDFNNPITGAPVASQYFYDTVNEHQYTQEFNIISPDDRRFTWLLGAFGVWNNYYFPAPFSNFVIDVAYPFNLVAAQYNLKGYNKTRSLAAFGQVGFQITPALKLEVGGRYTASRSTNLVDVRQYGTPLLSDQTVKSDNFSYKASLGWEASPTQYVYGFVATGFRPGGLNLPVGLGDPPPFKSEKVTSYEAGWKGEFADGHLRTTLTGFYNRYEKFQVIIGYPTFPTFGIELNVEDPTTIYGVEAELEAHFGGLRVSAGVNALKSSLGEFYASDPRRPATGACDPLTGGPGANCIALEGRDQTYAPNFTFNFAAEYEIPLGDTAKLTPRVNFGHIAAQWATLFEDRALGDRLESRNILNAQLEWRRGGLAVTAYATNLTDQHYPGALNSGLYFAGAPRQYGIKVMKVF
ncbi:TonB-dependent receptor [Croceibacterium aestuarii]|uniref:TonB-dependent receptor n=1 Tax=Croceibacterium aestuarii TaxID=3064139 RepID=UPI00272DD615|nr:TonB-dependent receptor [Croceibacterium sp. D39]